MLSCATLTTVRLALFSIDSCTVHLVTITMSLLTSVVTLLRYVHSCQLCTRLLT
jgi:hypothetical protein